VGWTCRKQRRLASSSKASRRRSTEADSPRRPADLATLLNVARLEKSVYELAYELNNRPDWVAIPVHGLRRLLAEITD